jgi:hypothetical protein
MIDSIGEFAETSGLAQRGSFKWFAGVNMVVSPKRTSDGTYVRVIAFVVRQQRAHTIARWQVKINNSTRKDSPALPTR